MEATLRVAAERSGRSNARSARVVNPRRPPSASCSTSFGAGLVRHRRASRAIYVLTRQNAQNDFAHRQVRTIFRMFDLELTFRGALTVIHLGIESYAQRHAHTTVLHVTRHRVQRACLPSFLRRARSRGASRQPGGRTARGRKPCQSVSGRRLVVDCFSRGALTSLEDKMFLALAASAAAYVTAPPASLRRTEVLRPLDPLMVAGPCLIKVCVSLTPPHTQAAIHVNARRRSSVLVVAVAML